MEVVSRLSLNGQNRSEHKQQGLLWSFIVLKINVTACFQTLFRSQKFFIAMFLFLVLCEMDEHFN